MIDSSKKTLLLLMLLCTSFSAWAQKPTRSWDGKYYYDDDFMDGWILVINEKTQKPDTLHGYVKQYMPYDDIKSCNQVIFKKRLSDGRTKYDAADVLEYYRYDELYKQKKLPNGKIGLLKCIENGKVRVWSYYGKKMSMDLGSNLSFSTEKELVQYDYISKDGEMERIDWDDPYGHFTLKIYVADRTDIDTKAFKANMTMEDLLPVIKEYNKHYPEFR